jgi:hypothetical protein
VWLVYASMMDYASGGGYAVTATLFAMCILLVVVMTAGLYGWGRWF